MKQNFNIRLGDLRGPVERAAQKGGVSVAEVVRLCIVGSLPVVERAFSAMQAEFQKSWPEGAQPVPINEPLPPNPEPMRRSNRKRRAA